MAKPNFMRGTPFNYKLYSRLPIFPGAPRNFALPRFSPPSRCSALKPPRASSNETPPPAPSSDKGQGKEKLQSRIDLLSSLVGDEEPSPSAAPARPLPPPSSPSGSASAPSAAQSQPRAPTTPSTRARIAEIIEPPPMYPPTAIKSIIAAEIILYAASLACDAAGLGYSKALRHLESIEILGMPTFTALSGSSDPVGDLIQTVQTVLDPSMYHPAGPLGDFIFFVDLLVLWLAASRAENWHGYRITGLVFLMSGITGALVSWGRGVPSSLELVSATLGVVGSLPGFYLLNSTTVFEDRTKLMEESQASLIPLLTSAGFIGLLLFLSVDGSLGVDAQPAVAGLIAGVVLGLSLGPQYEKERVGQASGQASSHPSKSGTAAPGRPLSSPPSAPSSSSAPTLGPQQAPSTGPAQQAAASSAFQRRFEFRDKRTWNTRLAIALFYSLQLMALQVVLDAAAGKG